MKSTKTLILGIARTGAKFTPKNHQITGDRIFDAMNAGDLIPVEPAGVRAELKVLYDLGVRYFHEHARNPQTREQTAKLAAYQTFSGIFKEVAPDALLSFGGSRNGPEISDAIECGGELVRVAQAGLPLQEGGAHFVTTQAAIELQVVTDMERQGFVKVYPEEGRYELLKALEDYKPGKRVEDVKLEVNSTAGGGNYGSSSAAVQMKTLCWSIETRRKLGLPYEVEWVQEARSSLLTWYLANALPNGLRSIGRLNITILFGFSPRLPFPESYAAFRRLVEKAHAIGVRTGEGPQGRLKVSVSVGAAILPKYAAASVAPVDVGPLAGMQMGPMERLAVYAAQPDSGVDILRVGLEDTPFILSPADVPVPATNALLVERVKNVLAAHDVALDLDPTAFADLSPRR